jgi:hypothetical protein
MSSDTQFTALGQSSGTAVGFQTHGTHIDKGVEAFGNILGVSGASESGPGVVGHSTTRPGVVGTSTAVEGVSGSGAPGVFGVGHKSGGVTGNNGVMGVARGDLAAGVFGGHLKNAQSPPATLDVTSFDAVDSHGAGVYGFSDASNGVRGLSTAGVGVFGEARRGKEGVRGVSPLGTGVIGTGVGGVEGQGGISPGVFGTSEHNCGGKFQSGTKKRPGVLTPQLNLVPHPMQPIGPTIPATPQIFNPTSKNLPLLPAKGEGGDFLVTEDKQQACTLWFCVRSNNEVSKTPALWSQVMMGNPVSGRG